MSKETRVGIPLRRVNEGEQENIQSMVGDYIASLERAGVNPVLIPMTSSPGARRKLFDGCHAICFPGGIDIDPVRYGSKINPKFNVVVDQGRDEFEWETMDWTLVAEKPFLAVCRGIQLLNVFTGGTLWQDLKLDAKLDERHWFPDSTLAAHQIHISTDSMLREIVGKDSINVNSFHHQGIRKLSKQLRAVAYSPGGLVEAVEMRDYPFGLGVQFHPEMLSANRQWARRLFTAFVDKSRVSIAR